VILRLLDQWFADLDRVTSGAREAEGRTNQPDAVVALQASIQSLVDRAAEFGISVELRPFA
jgi:hypothetical protein